MARSRDEVRRERDERERQQREQKQADSPPASSPGPTNGTNGTGRHLKRTGWHELSTIEAQDQLVHGLIGSNQLVVLYGESGSGKSFLAFDFGAHFALGREWLGRAVAGGGVLYIAAEGRGGWANRVTAFCQHHQLDEEARVMVPFQFVLESINLGRNGGLDVAAIIEAAKDASTEFGPGRPVRLIIVDTMARAMPGSNENDPVDMGAFVSSVDTIREQTGATVVIVHHSGKNAALGARGHSSLRAAVDSELEVERTNGSRMLRVRKSRDGDDGAEMAFKLNVVEIGRDADDQPITSCVINGADAEEHRKAKGAKAKGKAHWQLAVDYFNNTLADFPETVHGTGFPTGIPVTTMDRFRDALTKASIIDGETPGSRRVQWKRIKDTLIKKGMMRVNGEYCWRADFKAEADA